MQRTLTVSLKFSCALALLLGLIVSSIRAQTTSFTYQGRLTDNVLPANGPYDFQFKLFDAAVGGTQIGATVTPPSSTQVSTGIFTVTLDFGAAAFPGAPRWLEISAKQMGSGTFTTLTPRQLMTSTPYAVRSLNATTADNATQLNGQPAAQYVLTIDPRLSDARPPTAGSGNYIQNTINQQANSNFNISGTGTVGGTLSGNTINAATQYNLGGNRFLSTAGTDNLFVGINLGINNTGVSNSFFGAAAGTNNTSGGGNSFFGRSAGQMNATGGNNSFFGQFAGLSNTAGADNTFLGRNAGATNVLGSGNTFVGADAGKNNTGGGNVFAGNAAGFNNLSGSDNVFIGTGAGNTNTGGGNNILIGKNANVQGPNQTNSTAIGTGAVVSCNDCLVLGNNVNVGIGTDNPQHRLHVVGNIFATGTITPSDQNYKQNILPLRDALGKVRQLRGVSYDWNQAAYPEMRFAAGTQVGFIAQEVEQVLPEAVHKSSSGMYSMNYSAVIPLLVEALKEQQEQVAEKNRQLEQLKKESAAIEARLATLEKMMRRTEPPKE